MLILCDCIKYALGHKSNTTTPSLLTMSYSNFKLCTIVPLYLIELFS